MEDDLSTFLYDAGSLKVGSKPVLKRGALFPRPLPCLYSVYTWISSCPGWESNAYKIQSGGHARPLLQAEFLFHAQVQLKVIVIVCLLAG